MITALQNIRIISDGQLLTGLNVLLKDNKILDLVISSDVPTNARLIDLQNAYLSPAFIDLQIYGSGGKLFGGKPEVSALRQMEHDLYNQGCTGFLATVATNTPEVFEKAIAAAKAFRSESKGIFWGLHFEGPYLNHKRKGAHPHELIKRADLDEIKRWIDLADGELKMMTIAPELQSDAVLDYLNQQHIILSVGHSDASYAEANRFLNGSIPAATHLYNAMPPLHHRQPGLIAAIFNMSPFTSIIADGIHVDFAMIKLAKKILGNKLFLITDAVTEMNTGVYQHRLQGDHYVMPDGTLSGSSISMLQSVKNIVGSAGIPLPEAVNMASLYPAILMKKDQFKGKIKSGFDADMLVLDENLSLIQVIFQGNMKGSVPN
jgi:N-acetylglucosamine-6-phosphate deacetylase